MPAPTCVFTLNAFPDGLNNTLDMVDFYGSIAIGAGGTYPTNGILLTFSDPNLQVYTPKPSWGDLASPSTGLTYAWDSAHQSIRVFTAYGTEATGGSTTISADTVQARFSCNRETSPVG